VTAARHRHQTGHPRLDAGASRDAVSVMYQGGERRPWPRAYPPGVLRTASSFSKLPTQTLRCSSSLSSVAKSPWVSVTLVLRRETPVTPPRPSRLAVIGNRLVSTKREPDLGGWLDLKELPGERECFALGRLHGEAETAAHAQAIWISGVVNPCGPQLCGVGE